MLEPYRPDLTDLQVGVRTWPTLELSAIERPIRASAGADILDYRDKYVAGEGMAGANRELPAQISLRAGEGASVTPASGSPPWPGSGAWPASTTSPTATDFVVNEINTIPGSLARYLWVTPVLPFSTLLGDLLAEARQRPTHAYSAAGADGTVLRSAGSIAGKLG